MSTPSPELVADYRQCRRLNARHGKTFYLATALLPAAKRPAIHALYGFARYADDLVDRPEAGSSPADRLRHLADEVSATLAGGRAGNPVVRALVDTLRRYGIAEGHVTDFLAAMSADLRVSRYDSFDDLAGYMWGSAAVIGLQVLPVLGLASGAPGARPEEAEARAAELGIAFQLTNFVRDVGEDYRRGRIYLPMRELAAHGVTEPMLGRPAAGPELRSLIASEVARARSWYLRAAPGIELLAPDSRDCVRTAYRLYSGILDEVEQAGYDVLRARARVPRRRRLAVALTGYRSALRARGG